MNPADSFKGCDCNILNEEASGGKQKDKDTNTQLPATPAVSDQDSSEDDDYITKVTPDVTKAGRRIKIPNRLDL
ncbi:hypothetical protein HNY73_011755 [Argiope bruennichi]|uniref:Uncharacterized protein n=1 Tax=Argiope bruennichi TaxID=94029 RepID=A0A8T0EYD6_ARGBR|nr:hypothetical protein HNY73_011755 [Argiope bruennichi]